jgi:hypothetical protein
MVYWLKTWLLSSLYEQSTFNNHFEYPLSLSLSPQNLFSFSWLRWPTNGESQLFIPEIHLKPHNHIKKKPLKYKWDEFRRGLSYFIMAMVLPSIPIGITSYICLHPTLIPKC